MCVFNKEGFLKRAFLEHNTRLDTDIRERDYKDAFFLVVDFFDQK